MTSPEPVAFCVPPGGQIVLFSLPLDGAAPNYIVTDRDGRARADTNSLGVALAVTRRVLEEHGEAWVRASDDTTAHVHGRRRVSSDTPDRPWIASIATTLDEG
jgi:hypothetical protein